MAVVTHTRAESAPQYIAISDAVKQGYASRATINRWITDGFVKSTLICGHRYVSLGDVEELARRREAGLLPVLNTDVVTNQIANKIAAVMPVLSDEQKQYLSDLLAGNDVEEPVRDGDTMLAETAAI